MTAFRSALRVRAHVAFVMLATALLGAVPARATGQALAPGIALATFDTAWSRIDRTYFDTTFLQTRWRVLRDSLRPIADRASTNIELRRVLQVLLSSIGTSHFGLIPREAAPALSALDAAAGGGDRPGTDGRGGAGDVGASLRLAGASLIVWRAEEGGAAWAAGIRPGDVVRRVNGVALDNAVAELASITDAAVQRQARLTLTMRANAMLTGSVGDSVAMTIERNGASREAIIPRRPSGGAMIRFGNLPPLNARVDAREQRAGDRRVGVIAFSAWLPAIFPQIDSAIHRFRDADGIVLDLRGNPGGLAALTGRLAGHLLDSAYALGTLYMRTSTLNLVANPQRVAPDGATRVRPYDGPVAVLIDPLSASASEFFAAGMQGLRRVRVFGDTSAGASVPALMGRLPNGDVMLHAVADHLDSRGRRVEGRGVIPDEIIPLDASAVAAGHDAPLTAAIEWILGHQRRGEDR